MQLHEFKKNLSRVAPRLNRSLSDQTLLVAIRTVATECGYPHPIEPMDMVRDTCDALWAHIRDSGWREGERT